MTVEVFGIDDERLPLALAVRTAVFVREQGVPVDLEIDEHDRTDKAAVHALLFADGAHVGAGRFYESGERSVQIGRMAVVAPYRRRGFGRAILDALVESAGRRGYRAARLHAQLSARAFYRRAGFEDDGPRLWDAGIYHQPMRMLLGAAANS